MPPKRKTRSDAPASRPVRDVLLEQLDVLTAGDSPYFRAIDALVDGAYRVFVEIIDRPGGFVTTPETVEDDVHEAIVANHGDMLRDLVLDVQNLDDQGVAAIKTTLATDASWKAWREIFSFHHNKFTLTMIEAGRADVSHVKQVVYKMIARRWGLSVVNNINGLVVDQPPPYTKYKHPRRGATLAQHLLNAVTFFIMQMVITSKRVNTRDGSVLQTAEQVEVNDNYKKLNRSVKKLNDINLQLDTVMGRAVKAIQREARPAPVAQPDVPTVVAPTTDTANDLWCARRFEYDVSMRAALGEIEPDGALRMYPELQRVEEGASAFRTPTHLDYAATLQLPYPDKWQFCVAQFRDPVIAWLDAEIAEAADAETDLVRLNDLLREARAGRSTYAIQGLEEQIRQRDADVLQRRHDAASWDSAFMLSDDRAEMIRRLQLYEDNPILDLLIHVTNDIFAAEHQYVRALVEVSLHADWHASPQVVAGVVAAQQSLEGMLGEARAAERIRELTLEANVGTHQVLLGSLSRAMATLEQAKNSYTELVGENECFFVVNEVAARTIQEALRVASLEPAAPDSPWEEDMEELVHAYQESEKRRRQGSGRMSPATPPTGRRFTAVNRATMASIRAAVATWMSSTQCASVRKLVADSLAATSALPAAPVPAPAPVVSVPSVFDAERILRQRLMGIVLVSN